MNERYPLRAKCDECGERLQRQWHITVTLDELVVGDWSHIWGHPDHRPVVGEK